MPDLSEQQCRSNAPLLAEKEIERLMDSLSTEWALSDDRTSISRSFKFKNYYETMAFVNVAAMVAHQQDHHPDMSIGYNTCRIEYSTHSAGGLSENDFICAEKTNKTLKL
jgi:4a-hydroxytetrahydrobiopterin dehydratase